MCFKQTAIHRFAYNLLHSVYINQRMIDGDCLIESIETPDNLKALGLETEL